MSTFGATEARFEELARASRSRDSYWLSRAILEFTEQVYGAMEEEAVSKSALAERLNTSSAYVTKMLRGDTNFTLKTMVKVARRLRRSVSVLVVPDSAISQRADGHIRDGALAEGELVGGTAAIQEGWAREAALRALSGLAYSSNVARWPINYPPPRRLDACLGGAR